MSDLITICRTTYTRILRTRALYFLLVVSLLIVAAAHLYNDLTMGRQKELMYDTGAALLEVVALLSALIVVFEIARDVREKLVMTLLSKPLGRTSYLFGKFAGVVWVGTVNLAILTAGIAVLLHWEYGAWRPDFLQTAVATWGVMVMSTAVGLLLATFMSEVPAAILSVIVFIVGHMTEGLYRSGARVLHWIFGVLPNFSLLQFKTELASNLSVSWSLIGGAVLYALVYSVALLALATIFFHRRDLA